MRRVQALVFGFGIGINVSTMISIAILGRKLIHRLLQTTNAVFLGTPLPGGYGFSQFGIAGAYATPIVRNPQCIMFDMIVDILHQVAVAIGEVLGRYFNDWVMNYSIRRNKGVFIAENRLWYVIFSPLTAVANVNRGLIMAPYRTCYIAVPLYICGFLVLGASFQKHLSVGALIMGWGIAQVAIMINTVAVCECSSVFIWLLP